MKQNNLDPLIGRYLRTFHVPRSIGKDILDVMIDNVDLETLGQRIKEALWNYHLQQVDRVGERVYGIAEGSPPARTFALATIKSVSVGKAPMVELKLRYVGNTTAGDRDCWDILIERLDLWLSKRYGVLITETPSAQLDTSAGATNRQSTPRQDKQIAATIVHYAVEHMGFSQRGILEVVPIDRKTYIKYKVRGWLLSDEGFQKTVTSGRTIAEEAQDVLKDFL